MPCQASVGGFVGFFCLFVFMDNLLPDSYLHFRFLISLLYFGVSKSAKQYLSCSIHRQLCILFDLVVVGVLQVNTWAVVLMK